MTTDRSTDDPIDIAQPYPDAPVPHGSGPEVVVSEEQLRIGTEWVPTGSVRVRRRVISEIRTVEVTVRREVLEVEEPTAVGAGRDADVGRRTGGPGAAGRAVQIVLREEVPELVTRVRPYERATISTVLVGDEPASVSEVVRRERVEVTGDGAPSESSGRQA